MWLQYEKVNWRRELAWLGGEILQRHLHCTGMNALKTAIWAVDKTIFKIFVLWLVKINYISSAGQLPSFHYGRDIFRSFLQRLYRLYRLYRLHHQETKYLKEQQVLTSFSLDRKLFLSSVQKWLNANTFIGLVNADNSQCNCNENYQQMQYNSFVND